MMVMKLARPHLFIYTQTQHPVTGEAGQLVFLCVRELQKSGGGPSVGSIDIEAAAGGGGLSRRLPSLFASIRNPAHYMGRPGPETRLDWVVESVVGIASRP